MFQDDKVHLYALARRAVARALRDGGWRERRTTIAAIDPSSQEDHTGWCVLSESESGTVLVSGEDDMVRAVEHVRAALGDDVGVDVLVVEQPYIVGVGNQWKLAWAGGYALGNLLDYCVSPSGYWTPRASTWRSVLGLNKGVGGSRKGKDVDAAVHAWAQSYGRKPLLRGRGAPAVDEANAIGMAAAALHMITIEHAYNPSGRQPAHTKEQP